MGYASRAREEKEARPADVPLADRAEVIVPPARAVTLEVGSRVEFAQADGAARATHLVVDSVRMFPNGKALVGVSRDMERSPKGTPPGSYVLRVYSPLAL